MNKTFLVERGILFTSQKVRVIESDQSNEANRPVGCLKRVCVFIEIF